MQRPQQPFPVSRGNSLVGEIVNTPPQSPETSLNFGETVGSFDGLLKTASLSFEKMKSELDRAVGGSFQSRKNRLATDMTTQFKR